MEQRITIRIAGREYELKAPTPESEELIRLAAASVNKKISAFSTKYPGKPMEDILAFVALNESIGGFRSQRMLEALKQETEALCKDTDSYIENMEK